jgi:hypothetical protein
MTSVKKYARTKNISYDVARSRFVHRKPGLPEAFKYSFLGFFFF